MYDGELSHGVAFGELIAGEKKWFERIQEASAAGQTLISLAADGETFGHHHDGADRKLRRLIDRVRESPTHRTENFASCLNQASDLPELTLVEPSSWSCVHGVERWRSDCGCKMAPEVSSQQRWRAPLRDALDQLAAGLEAQYRLLAPTRLRDPERALDGLGRALGEPGAGVDRLERYTGDAAVSDAVAGEALVLLELMRDRAAMFTSCAWFFDDVAGIEGTQVLRYAAHAIDRLGMLSPVKAERLELAFVAALSAATSNDRELESAARVYSELAQRDRPAAAGE